MEVHVSVDVGVAGEVLATVAAAVDGATVGQHRRLARLVTLQRVSDNVNSVHTVITALCHIIHRGVHIRNIYTSFDRWRGRAEDGSFSVTLKHATAVLQQIQLRDTQRNVDYTGVKVYCPNIARPCVGKTLPRMRSGKR